MVVVIAMNAVVVVVFVVVLVVMSVELVVVVVVGIRLISCVDQPYLVISFPLRVVTAKGIIGK